MIVNKEIKNELIKRVAESLFTDTTLEVVVGTYIEELMADDSALLFVIHAALEYAGMSNSCDANHILQISYMLQCDKEFALQTRSLATDYLIDFISQDKFKGVISQIAVNSFINGVKQDVVNTLLEGLVYESQF